MVASSVFDSPERGVPYSVSWYEQHGMMRADRVYLVAERNDPWRYELIDALSGALLIIHPDQQPLWRGPTQPSAHRTQLAAEWGRRVSPVRVHRLEHHL